MEAAAVRPRVWVSMVVVGVAVAVAAALAIPARATYGARTTADEPQYLLTALSLARDGDLDISDEIEAREFEPFHEITVDRQTEVLGDGREISPHDPLLPLLLAPAMLLPGDVGWVAAKLTLAALAGVLAALLVWVAVRRFGVATRTAGIVVACFGVTAPLTAYGTQVYPELPAALATTAAVALLTSRLEPRHLVGLVVAVSALPWLGVKYAPVAVALVGVLGWTLVRAGRTRTLLATVAALAISGVAFLVAHRMLYGGWTVYATGDHFTQTGELSVVGTNPDYLGRTRRIVGLVVDRSFGLAAWAPLYLVVTVALGAVARGRPRGWLALVAPLAAGWATATWVALTMHGWWWPGRQVVVVVPCLVLAVAWTAEARPRMHLVRWCVVGAAVGVGSWAWLVAEVVDGTRTLIVDFYGTGNPVYGAWRAVLPDGLRGSRTDDLLLVAWTAVLALAGWWGWRQAGAVAAPPSVAGDEDAGAGELADAHVAALDLDGDRAVR
jgi:hypothetical protein